MSNGIILSHTACSKVTHITRVGNEMIFTKAVLHSLWLL